MVATSLFGTVNRVRFSVHSSKAWFRVIGSIGSEDGRVFGKATPPLSTTATWRLEPSGGLFLSRWSDEKAEAAALALCS